MNMHYGCSAHMRKAVSELHRCPSIQIASYEFERSDRSDVTPAEVDAAVQEQFDTRLPVAVGQCAAAHERYACDWRIEGRATTVVGEFYLSPPVTSLPLDTPSLDWSIPESEKYLSEQFLVVDDFPGGGTDAYVALRLHPGIKTPELWYHEAERGALRLDLDYCGYMHALAVTKGALGWQFLFAEASFSEPEFSPFIDVLTGMLGEFPRLFPDHDYTPLRARLEARL